MMLTEIESIADAGIISGMFCSGPIDMWSSIENVASATQHAIYWLPRTVYETVPNSVHQTLCAQVSTCPFWAFSTQ